MTIKDIYITPFKAQNKVSISIYETGYSDLELGMHCDYVRLVETGFGNEKYIIEFYINGELIANSKFSKHCNIYMNKSVRRLTFTQLDNILGIHLDKETLDRLYPMGWEFKDEDRYQDKY